MSQPIALNWGAWSAFDANLTGSAAIAAGASLQSATINNSGVVATEVEVTLTYGSTAGAAVVSICRSKAGTFQTSADAQASFSAPAAPSSTLGAVFTVRSIDAGDFQVLVSNPAGNSGLTGVGLKYRQATGSVG
jgi:hypothetical protein